MAAGRWVGRRDKDGADAAAVAAMRAMMGTVAMDGLVVIGEGEKDDAPMLYNGERVGAGTPCDVAVDPVDGTTLTFKGMGNAVSVLAVAPRGAMYDPSAVYYVDKLVAGPDAVGVVDIRQSPEDNIAALARAKECAPEDITVCMLDRPGMTIWPAGSPRRAPGSSSSPMATSPRRCRQRPLIRASTCCYGSVGRPRE